MTYAVRGRYRGATTFHPEAAAQCDRSQSIFKRSDLEWQKEWMGNSLKKTGELVARMYLDEPNPQLRPPLVKNDPEAIKDPRPLYDLPDSPQVPPVNVLLEQLRQTNWHWNEDNYNN